MKTYRFRGHSRTDPAKYRAEGELEAWLLRDPITLLGATLELSEADQSAMHDEVQQLVDETADRAKELGGTVSVPPMDIPDMGRFAVLSDPQGAAFAVFAS